MTDKSITGKASGWLHAFGHAENHADILRRRIEEGQVKDRRKTCRTSKILKIGFSVLCQDTSVPLMDGYGHTTSISPEGLCMATPEDVSPQKMMQIDLQFPDAPYHAIVLAEVVWCGWDEGTGLNKIAVRFLAPLSKRLRHALGWL